MPKLSEIAEIHAGHAFRGAVIPDSAGEYLVIQMKDVGQDLLVGWEEAERTNPPGKKKPAHLDREDIIFLARGRHNYAIHINEPPPIKAICTQHFFVIRVVDTHFSPAFVAWQINQAHAQDHFNRNAAGGKNRSITLSTLKSTEIVYTDSANQRQIEKLALLVQQEQQLFESMMTNRINQMSVLAELILKSGAAE